MVTLHFYNQIEKRDVVDLISLNNVKSVQVGHNMDFVVILDNQSVNIPIGILTHVVIDYFDVEYGKTITYEFEFNDRSWQKKFIETWLKKIKHNQ
jgi:hypothetical protein